MMNYSEALEWLEGRQSSWNFHCQHGDGRNESRATCAREDAARTEQAYWVVRAHRAGLIGSNGTFTITVSKDGDSWCALKGEDLQEGIAGFGETPVLALGRLIEELNRPLTEAAGD